VLADILDNFQDYDPCPYHVQPDAKRALCLSLSGQNKLLQKQVMLFDSCFSFWYYNSTYQTDLSSKRFNIIPSTKKVVPVRIITAPFSRFFKNQSFGLPHF